MNRVNTCIIPNNCTYHIGIYKPPSLFKNLLKENGKRDAWIGSAMGPGKAVTPSAPGKPSSIESDGRNAMGSLDLNYEEIVCFLTWFAIAGRNRIPDNACPAEILKIRLSADQIAEPRAIYRLCGEITDCNLLPAVEHWDAYVWQLVSS